MDSVTNVISIKSNSKLKITPEGDFFRVWVEFLRPIHNLAKREMDVLACMLKLRDEMHKVIKDETLLDNVLMSVETRRKIKELCGISNKHFQVIMSRFRKNGVIVNNKIYPNLIPTTTEAGVGLLVYFNFDNEHSFKHVS